MGASILSKWTNPCHGQPIELFPSTLLLSWKQSIIFVCRNVFVFFLSRSSATQHVSLTSAVIVLYKTRSWGKMEQDQTPSTQVFFLLHRFTLLSSFAGHIISEISVLFWTTCSRILQSPLLFVISENKRFCLDLPAVIVCTPSQK